MGFSDVSKESPTPALNQFYLGSVFNKFYNVLKKLGTSIWFWMSLGIILAGGISYFLWWRFQDRLENDPAFARRLKAVKEARQALAPARGVYCGGKDQGFLCTFIQGFT